MDFGTENLPEKSFKELRDRLVILVCKVLVLDMFFVRVLFLGHCVPEKWTFLSLAFFNGASLRTVKTPF